MKINLDEYEIDLLIESIEYRIENDHDLIMSKTLKEELQELLRKIEEDDYE